MTKLATKAMVVTIVRRNAAGKDYGGVLYEWGDIDNPIWAYGWLLDVVSSGTPVYPPDAKVAALRVVPPPIDFFLDLEGMCQHPGVTSEKARQMFEVTLNALLHDHPLDPSLALIFGVT